MLKFLVKYLCYVQICLLWSKNNTFKLYLIGYIRNVLYLLHQRQHSDQDWWVKFYAKHKSDSKSANHLSGTYMYIPYSNNAQFVLLNWNYCLLALPKVLLGNLQVLLETNILLLVGQHELLDIIWGKNTF